MPVANVHNSHSTPRLETKQSVNICASSAPSLSFGSQHPNYSHNLHPCLAALAPASLLLTGASDRHTHTNRQACVRDYMCHIGPPGCGKTHLLSGLASLHGFRTVVITREKALRKRPAQAALGLRALWADALALSAAMPVMLVLDHFDEFFPARDDNFGAESFDEQTLGGLMASWQRTVDTQKTATLFVVATAADVWRVSRAARALFSVQLALPLPDIAQRAAILQSLLSPNDDDDLDIATTSTAAAGTAATSSPATSAASRSEEECCPRDFLDDPNTPQPPICPLIWQVAAQCQGQLRIF
jgi:hypothetical protein